MGLVPMGWGMKRWLIMAGFAAMIATLGAVVGCQPTFMTREMYQEAHAPLSRDLEGNSCPITKPLTSLTAAPATFGFGSVEAATTRTTPAWINVSAHGGVRPVWLQGSSVT